MKEVGTLNELGVKAGDVVKCVNGGSVYDVVVITPHTKHKRAIYCNIGELYALSRDGNNHQSVRSSSQPQWRVVSRATPKLWRDMTPEEKGALLLAAHEGKEIEWTGNGGGEFYRSSAKGYMPVWSGSHAYRIKPTPKVEVVTVYGNPSSNVQWVYEQCPMDTHRITFNLIDGKPDCATVKMECA